jgi:hypothetical protein
MRRRKRTTQLPCIQPWPAASSSNRPGMSSCSASSSAITATYDPGSACVVHWAAALAAMTAGTTQDTADTGKGIDTADGPLETLERPEKTTTSLAIAVRTQAPKARATDFPPASFPPIMVGRAEIGHGIAVATNKEWRDLPNDFEKRTKSGARQPAFSGAMAYVFGTAVNSLSWRREARGRPAATVQRTIKAVRLVLLVTALIGAIAIAANDTTAGEPVVTFLFFGVIFTVVVWFLAIAISLVALGLVEIVASAKGTLIARPGHFLTLEEIDVQAIYWDNRVRHLNGQMPGSAALVVAGAGAFLGGDLAAQGMAHLEAARCVALSDRVRGDQQVWVNDQVPSGAASDRAPWVIAAMTAAVVVVMALVGVPS